MTARTTSVGYRRDGNHQPKGNRLTSEVTTVTAVTDPTRGVEEKDHALSFNPEIGSWTRPETGR